MTVAADTSSAQPAEQAPAEPIVVTEPGVYDGMPDDVYHGDPVPGGSMSSTIARRILPPGCPAAVKWERDNGRPNKRTFDFGHAAHQLVLGAGPELVTVAADNWLTKAAKAQRDEAYAAGAVPLLTHERAQVDGMVAAILEHPVASAVLNPEIGKPEQSLFWRDPRLPQVWRRARVDFLPDPNGGLLIQADYKTTISADPATFAKSFANYGYHCQAAWYMDAVLDLGLADDVAFVLVAQEKTPPYLVTVFEPDPRSIEIGQAENRRAIELYAACQAADEWPPYASDVVSLSLPPWVLNKYQELSA